MTQPPMSRLSDRLSDTWLEGSARFQAAMTTAIVTALYEAVVPGEENRLPERDPSELDADE